MAWAFEPVLTRPMPADGIMSGSGEENDRLARALGHEVMRERLMAECAQRSKMCAWAAVLQAGIAFALFWLPSNRNAHYLFLWVAFCFFVLCMRSRRDLKLLKLAGQPPMDGTAPHTLRRPDYPCRPSCSAAGSTSRHPRSGRQARPDAHPPALPRLRCSTSRLRLRRGFASHRL